MPGFLSLNTAFAPVSSSNKGAPLFAQTADPPSTGQVLSALADTVLCLGRLSNELTRVGLAPTDPVAFYEQLKRSADHATEAMQQLRTSELGLSPPATQLSQALTVLVLVASLLQNHAAEQLDPELSGLLAHNARRALHSLGRLLSFYHQRSGQKYILVRRNPDGHTPLRRPLGTPTLEAIYGWQVR